MRTLFVAAATVAVLASAVPARASTDGILLLPTLGSNGLARCAYVTGGEATNGVLGWMFPVGGGAAFSLVPTGPAAAAADVAVVFYFGDLGTCSLTGPASLLHNNAGMGEAESGAVPDGATHALVVMPVGAPATTFTWA